jgi:UDP-N-acetylglucosamine 4,6-dehydratase
VALPASNGMKVLITGITGTLGKELVGRFYNQWEIIGFSRDELKQAQLQRQYPNVKCIIGDVRDYDSVYKAMQGVDVVIHAAAMKRIEVCEENPLEAIKTNVLGTENVARAAHFWRIPKVVTIGSDKGVDPVNAYGMTKALQEKVFIAYNFNCVRYGNVFGSRGSVIPLFHQQMEKGEPLTVTDPNMTRFILTVDDAVELILLAMDSPMRGDVFIKRSPAARLIDIAHAFSDNVRIIGKMRGEKLHEALIAAEEFTRLTEAENGVIGKELVRSEYSLPYTSDKERLLTIPEIKQLIGQVLADPAFKGVETLSMTSETKPVLAQKC